MHDPNTQAKWEPEYRKELEKYFEKSAGSISEKLENFPKYVPRQNLARFLARYEIFKLIKNIQGSIVECGVLFGTGLMSFAHLSTILEPYNFQRRIIGFDTFSGFPNISEKDTQGISKKAFELKKGGYSAHSIEDLQEAIRIFNMNRYLNHFPKIELVKGDFNETIEKYLEEHSHLVISCLYLDFDIYSPTKTAIEKLLPLVPKGGVVIFDELNEELFPGETIAVKETLELSKFRIKRFSFEPRISYTVIGD